MDKTITLKVVEGGHGTLAGRMREQMAPALLALGEYWHRNFLKWHFSLGAFLRYGGVYRARSAWYTRTKLRRWGSVSPLVASGKLMHAVMTSARIRGTGDDVIIEMNGPAWLRSFRRKRGVRVNMVAELKAVSPGERIELARRLRDSMVKR